MPSCALLIIIDHARKQIRQEDSFSPKLLWAVLLELMGLWSNASLRQKGNTNAWSSLSLCVIRRILSRFSSLFGIKNWQNAQAAFASQLVFHTAFGSFRKRAALQNNRLAWYDLDLSVKPYRSLRYHQHALQAVAYHRSYPLFASASDDATVHIFHGMVYQVDLAALFGCMPATHFVPLTRHQLDYESR